MKNKESSVVTPRKHQKTGTSTVPKKEAAGSEDGQMKKDFLTPSQPVVSSKKSNTKNHEVTRLRDLFVAQLKDIYWAEKALTRAIPAMIEKASSEELITALKDHLDTTGIQVVRCEEVFASINAVAAENTCEAMAGLIKEATEIMESTREGSVRDAGIICAAQKIEHYEISSYGTLAAYARQLGETEAASLLDLSLTEEKEADASLTQVAESNVNEQAIDELLSEGKEVRR